MFFKSLDQDLDVVEDVGVVTSGIFQDGASNILIMTFNSRRTFK